MTCVFWTLEYNHIYKLLHFVVLYYQTLCCDFVHKFILFYFLVALNLFVINLLYQI